jgi:hypothetical protein
MSDNLDEALLRCMAPFDRALSRRIDQVHGDLDRLTGNRSMGAVLVRWWLRWQLRRLVRRIPV